MHVVTKHRPAKRLHLDPIDSHFEVCENLPLLRVDLNTASPRVSEAPRIIFGVDDKEHALLRKRGHYPAVFRDRHSGRIRMVYREAVIRFAPGTSERKRKLILNEHGFRCRSVNPYHPDQIVVFDPARRRIAHDLLDVTNDWVGMDEVIFATPNFVSQYRRESAPAPTVGPIRGEQWHLENRAQFPRQKIGEDIKATAAWKVTRGEGIVVAVLDDGVDVDHPDLKANILQNPDPQEPRDLCGRDFFLRPDEPGHFDPRPKSFEAPYAVEHGNDVHGTLCAGLVGAAGIANGAIGVAPGCRILPVKIFHADQMAADDRVANAIRYAASHADILSCSWSSGDSPDVEHALQDAKSLGRGGKGAAVFCGAGNDHGNSIQFPASYQHAIAIGASTDRGTHAAYSNRGPELWAVAPSSGGIKLIFTTDVSIPDRGRNTGNPFLGGQDGLYFSLFSGTSAATPIAAGVAALALSAKPQLNVDELKTLLARTADKIGSGYDANGHSSKFGFGRLNAANAVS